MSEKYIKKNIATKYKKIYKKNVLKDKVKNVHKYINKIEMLNTMKEVSNRKRLKRSKVVKQCIKRASNTMTIALQKKNKKQENIAHLKKNIAYFLAIFKK